MKRSEFNHNNIEGVDVNIEISLKEYGIAWIKDKKETLIYYGIKMVNGEWTNFDFNVVKNNLNLINECSWIDIQDITSHTGMDIKDWNNMEIQYKIYDVINYYGYEDICGTSYSDGVSYEEIFSNIDPII